VVQSYVESAAGRGVGAGREAEKRTSRIVIIGQELENERWRDDLARCAAR